MSYLNLEEEEMDWLNNIFIFPFVDMQAGLKYLGFILKPNDYNRKDWIGLLEKLGRDSLFGARNGNPGVERCC